jgi:hypothetical protein
VKACGTGQYGAVTSGTLRAGRHAAAPCCRTLPLPSLAGACAGRTPQRAQAWPAGSLHSGRPRPGPAPQGPPRPLPICCAAAPHLAVPVTRGAQAAQLVADVVRVLAHPLPHLLQERLAPQVVPRLALLPRNLPLHHSLRGDAGVVGAGHPQRVVAAHAPPTHHRVLSQQRAGGGGTEQGGRKRRRQLMRGKEAAAGSEERGGRRGRGERKQCRGRRSQHQTRLQVAAAAPLSRW